jgi:hypothetical protein
MSSAPAAPRDRALLGLAPNLYRKEVSRVPANAAEIDHVFILRFWRESASDRSREMHWRARIRCVNTSEQFYADGIDGACTMVRLLLLEVEMNAGS